MARSEFIAREEALARSIQRLAVRDDEPAWPMGEVQAAYSAALRELNALKGLLAEATEGPGTGGARGMSGAGGGGGGGGGGGNGAELDTFWRRRQGEAGRLGRELASALARRRAHTERGLAAQLFAGGGGGGNGNGGGGSGGNGGGGSGGFGGGNGIRATRSTGQARAGGELARPEVSSVGAHSTLYGRPLHSMGDPSFLSLSLYSNIKTYFLSS